MEINPFPNKKDLWLSESHVIDILLDWKDSTGFYDMRHFMNILFLPIDTDNFSKIKGVYVAKNVLRTKLGFKKDDRPGDYDVMLIPYTVDSILFDRTAVFEVKIVRPTRNKPQKNADSMGVTQLKGLINDGFPLVGLMHITMPEPLQEHEKMEMDFCVQPLDVDDPFNNKGVFESTIKVKRDHFSWYSADKQIQRLLALDIPKYVGLSCFGLDGDKDGSFFLSSCSREFSRYEAGYFNPHSSLSTIQNIEKYFFADEKNFRKMQIQK